MCATALHAPRYVCSSAEIEAKACFSSVDEHQLFDLTKDPYELNNVYASTGQCSTQRPAPAHRLETSHHLRVRAPDPPRRAVAHRSLCLRAPVVPSPPTLARPDIDRTPCAGTGRQGHRRGAGKAAPRLLPVQGQRLPVSGTWVPHGCHQVHTPVGPIACTRPALARQKAAKARSHVHQHQSWCTRQRAAFLGTATTGLNYCAHVFVGKNNAHIRGSIYFRIKTKETRGSFQGALPRRVCCAAHPQARGVPAVSSS